MMKTTTAANTDAFDAAREAVLDALRDYGWPPRRPSARISPPSHPALAYRWCSSRTHQVTGNGPRPDPSESMSTLNSAASTASRMSGNRGMI